MSKKTKQEVVEVIIEEPVIIQPTIYDKFDKYVKQAQAGFIRDLNYSDAVEILRYCERQLNRNIPFNMSCATCVLQLVQLFINLKPKD
jgi:hypothetical protein